VLHILLYVVTCSALRPQRQGPADPHSRYILSAVAARAAAAARPGSFRVAAVPSESSSGAAADCAPPRDGAAAIPGHMAQAARRDTDEAVADRWHRGSADSDSVSEGAGCGRLQGGGSHGGGPGGSHCPQAGGSDSVWWPGPGDASGGGAGGAGCGAGDESEGGVHYYDLPFFIGEQYTWPAQCPPRSTVRLVAYGLAPQKGSQSCHVVRVKGMHRAFTATWKKA
jgi:hypothetical protein